MYYTTKSLSGLAKRLLGRRTYPARYDQILSEIDTLQPRTILEIGTNDGRNAVRLYKRAALHRPDVKYYGFDLFEAMTKDTFAHESSLAVPTQSTVYSYLVRNGCTNINLYAGNSLDTLPAHKHHLPKFDLVFIDGGHSLETVSSDWMNIQGNLHPRSVVFFDDYPNWGVRTVVDSIDSNFWDIQILPIQDTFPSTTSSSNLQPTFMSFQLARVQHRNSL